MYHDKKLSILRLRKSKYLIEIRSGLGIGMFPAVFPLIVS